MAASKRLQSRLKRVKGLFVHLVLTLVLTLGIIYGVDHLGLAARTEDDVIPILVLLLIAHALWVVYQEAVHAITQQEMQNAGLDDVMEEKLKRRLGVGDDGELTEIIYDEDAWDEKVKHSE
jgi:Co/Zn/Cd efflux system component